MIYTFKKHWLHFFIKKYLYFIQKRILQVEVEIDEVFEGVGL